MTTVVQQTYRPQIAPAYVGMIADMSLSSVQTRLCETVAGIGFGLAVGQGANTKGAVIGGSNFVGISVRDVTLDRVALNPLNTGPLVAADTYPQYSNMAVMSQGRIWVSADSDVAPGDSLFYNTTTGVLSNSASGDAATGQITFTTQPVDGQVVVVDAGSSGGTTITFKATGATGSQVNIGPTLADTITALASFINTNTAADAHVAKIKTLAYPNSPGGAGQGSGANTLLVSAVTVGTAGNAITLTTTVTGATVSGSGGALAGGLASATAVVGGYWLDSAIGGQIARISLGVSR